MTLEMTNLSKRIKQKLMADYGENFQSPKLKKMQRANAIMRTLILFVPSVRSNSLESPSPISTNFATYDDLSNNEPFVEIVPLIKPIIRLFSWPFFELLMR